MAQMGRFALTTTMTVDALIDVGEWFVAEGEQDRVAREQFEKAGEMIMTRAVSGHRAGALSYRRILANAR